MRRTARAAAALAATLAVAGSAAAHEFDHPAPAFAPTAPPSADTVNSSPAGAWQLVATVPTGNPHTDLDFFTQGGEIYVSAGTLAIGPNAGGQTIVRLTEGGEVTPTSVEFVSAHPSATCLVTNPTAALGLQHDVEAAPKGNVIFNTGNTAAVRKDAQLLLDATDQRGRCHDTTLGQGTDPRGGLEIIDITDVTHPVEIGLTSHIGEAHTVNVDPKRPHIAYAVTSDGVGVTCNADDTACTRSRGLGLDGFEVVDLSSCMNFPALTSVDVKRMTCKPQVFRYEYPSALIALGYSSDSLGGCHELEVYPNDRLTCASLNASILFDMKGAFDDNGTPGKFTDDHPRGTPLPCRLRPSVSPAPYVTGAMVTDCVDTDPTTPGNELNLAGWDAIGAPSLEGVKHLGTAFHQGGGSPHPATEEVSISHEAELSPSGRFLIVTDERGGGISPPGAACNPVADDPAGNGGLHAYRVDKLLSTSPATAAEAWESYARKPDGGKAIYRAPITTGPQESLCTSHVFQQIPGQNRIFMGWYSQGTQVVDFKEKADGTIEFFKAGHLTLPHANTWTSAVFKIQRNPDKTFTYWGATGDFALGAAGRSAIDVWKVTLSRPQTPRSTADPAIVMTMIGPSTAAPGESATYAITYGNIGAKAVENVTVAGALPSQLRFVSASDGGTLKEGRVSWKLGTLDAEEIGTVSVTVRVKGSTPAGTTIVNKAELTAAGLGGARTTSFPTAVVPG